MPGQQDQVHIFDAPVDEVAKQKLLTYIEEVQTKIEGFSKLSIFSKTVNGAGDFKKVSLELTQGINEMTEAEKKLQVVKAGTKQKTDEEIRAQATLQIERQKNLAAIKDEIRLNQAAQESLVRKRIELKQLQQQYDNLAGAIRNSAKGEELLTSIQVLNKEVLELETNSGRFGRQVGNYEIVSKSVQKLNSDLNAVKGQFAVLGKENLDALNHGLYDVTNQLRKMESAGKANTAEFQQLQNKQQAFNAAILNGVKSLSQVRGDLAQINEQMVLLEKNGLKDSEIYRELNANVKQVEASLHELGERGVQNTNQIRKSIGGAVDSLKEFGKELILQAAMFIGIYQAVEFFKESIKEFQHAQQEASKLNNILTNIGRRDVFERLKESAEDLSKEFKTIKSEDLVGVFDQLVVYGKLTENQIRQLTPVIINFAAQTGKSLEESTSIVLKGLEGNARGLKEFGINMKDGKDSAERFGIVMKELAPKVEGAAKAFGETMAGGVKSAEVEIDELKKKIGEDLQPVMKEFYTDLAHGLEGIPQVFEGIGDKVSFIKDRVVDYVLTVRSLLTGNFSAFNAEQSERAMAAGLVKTAKEFEDIRSNAKVVSDAASKTDLVEQEKYLEHNIALRDASAKVYASFTADQKKNSAEAHAAFLTLAKDQQVVANLIELVERTKDKRVLGSGDPDAGGEAKKRESLTSEIKAEAEARIKLLEIKEKEKLAELRVSIDNPGNNAFGRIKAAQQAAEVEQSLIHERLKIELQANDLERKDLKLTYDENIKAAKTNVAEKAFLSQKYYLQEKTLEENREAIVLNAEDEIYKKKIEYSILVIKLHAESLNQELADEAFTLSELTAMREAYYKAQETLAKTAYDRRKGYLDEARDIELKALDKSSLPGRIKGVQQNDPASEKAYQEKRKGIIEQASIYELQAQEEKVKSEIALTKLKGEQTINLEATYANLELQIEDLKEQKKLRIAKDAAEQKKQIRDGEVDLAKAAEETISSFVHGAYEKQINAIQDQIDANNLLKETETKNLQISSLSAQQKAAEQINLNAAAAESNEALQRKQRDIKLKEAQFDRDKAIFDIGVSTTTAVAKSLLQASILASNPLTAALAPQAYAMAAIEAGIGVAEIGAVLAKQLPKYKTGVDSSPEGLALVHPGEMRIEPTGQISMTPDVPESLTFLKRGTKIIPAEEVNSMLLRNIMAGTSAMIQGPNNQELERKLDQLNDNTTRVGQEMVNAIRRIPKGDNHIHIDTGFWAHIDNSCR